MSRKEQFDIPRLGVDYYPEDWPEEEIEKDIQRMKEHHISIIRFSEFAWSRIEPREDVYDFDWIEDVVNRFGEAGIDSILCTQSATPPQWMVRKYPDALMEQENGRRNSSGGRRNFCENHPGYRRAVMKITGKIAQRFGKNPHVIGWQVDNEIYPSGNGCFCENCVRGFREYLKAKYKTIENVNESFGTAHLFSQCYDSFDDIPAPRDAWMNPHLVMEWKNYKCDSMISFVHEQTEVIKKYSDAPTGTDVMPVPVVSYTRMFEPMDVVMFNHYNTPDNLEDVTFWFDHLRTLKKRPFWNTETAVNWNGAHEITQSIKPEGYCRANSWLPVAMGGEANMYWLFRTHWAGHELMHGALFDTCGKPAHDIGEVDRTGEEFEKAGYFIQNTEPAAQAALVYSPLASSMSASQPIVHGFQYMKEMVGTAHHAMGDCGLDPDVIDPSHDFSSYKLIVTPVLMSLEEADAGKRLARFVENGGTWIVLPFTDIRTLSGAKYKDRHFGMLEEFTGMNWLWGIPDLENRLELEDENGTAQADRYWVDVYDNPGDPGVKVLQSVKSGYSTLEGKPVSFEKKVGKGKILVLGSFPEREELARLVKRSAAEAGIFCVPSDAGSTAVHRKGAAGEGCIAVETHDRADTLHLARGAKDLLTGEHFEGEVPLEPYGVRVLKFD